MLVRKIPWLFGPTFAFMIQLCQEFIIASQQPQVLLVKNFLPYSPSQPSFVMHVSKKGLPSPFLSFRLSKARKDCWEMQKVSDIHKRTLEEEKHLKKISSFLNALHIECLRVNGMYSRLQIAGNAYALNTSISQNPQLQWTGISYHELIFRDEYNQEYRKSIFQP